MELYKAIAERRSIRRYKEDPVPAEALDRILEATQWAPSWAHTQTPEVVIVDDVAMKKALQATMPEMNPAYKAMLQAPVVAVFCARKDKAGFKKGELASPRGNEWMVFDTGLAMQNFMLAAHAEGLATVCIGLFDYKKAAEVVGLPDDMEVITMTPLGQTEQEPNLPRRKAREKFAHFNGYTAE